MRAMRDVLLDPELRGRMERLGLQRASLFTWERTAQRTLEIYHEVAGSRIRAAGDRSAAAFRCLAHEAILPLLFATAAASAEEAREAGAAAAARAKASKSSPSHYNVNWPSGLSLGEADLTSVFRRLGTELLLQDGCVDSRGSPLPSRPRAVPPPTTAPSNYKSRACAESEKSMRRTEFDPRR